MLPATNGARQFPLILRRRTEQVDRPSNASSVKRNQPSDDHTQPSEEDRGTLPREALLRPDIFSSPAREAREHTRPARGRGTGPEARGKRPWSFDRNRATTCGAYSRSAQPSLSRQTHPATPPVFRGDDA